MTKDEVRERIEYWQDVLAPLGIGHWAFTLDVSNRPERPWSSASANPSTNYDQVDFWVSEEKIESDGLSELDRTIIHEWLHCFLRDIDEAVDPAGEYLPLIARELWEKRVDHEREGVIERLSQLIYALHG